MSPFALQFPDIDPVAITVFGRPIYWYAIMYLLAFAIAYVLMRRRLHHEPYRSITKPSAWTPELIDDCPLLLDPRRDPRRPARVLLLLQPGLLPRESARHHPNLGRRDELPWWGARRDPRARPPRARQGPPIPAARRLPGPHDPARPRGRPDRQLHQRRAVGARGARGSAVGDDLPDGWRGGPPPVADLPGSPRRRSALRHPVALRTRTPPARPGGRRLPARLRHPALHRRVLPRAGRPPGIPLARHEHGPVALRADGHRGRGAARVGSEGRDR